jgi:hypothetical protein
MYTEYVFVGFVNEYLNGKFCGRRPVGRPRLRHEDIIRRDSLRPPTVADWRRCEIGRAHV